jgi:D-amino-acid oxidase
VPLGQYRTLEKEELIDGMLAGESFTSISVQPKTYLPWLEVELANRGVEFVRKKITSIEEAAGFCTDIDGDLVIVNATGLGTALNFLRGVAPSNVLKVPDR